MLRFLTPVKVPDNASFSVVSDVAKPVALSRLRSYWVEDKITVKTPRRRSTDRLPLIKGTLEWSKLEFYFDQDDVNISGPFIAPVKITGCLSSASPTVFNAELNYEYIGRFAYKYVWFFLLALSIAFIGFMALQINGIARVTGRFPAPEFLVLATYIVGLVFVLHRLEQSSQKNFDATRRLLREILTGSG